MEEVFEVFEVLVVRPEQRGNPLFGDGNAAHRSYYRSLPFVMPGEVYAAYGIPSRATRMFGAVHYVTRGQRCAHLRARVPGCWHSAGTTIASALVVAGQTRPGDLLPGITPVELAKASEGRDLFVDDFVDKDGLGPAFNATNCGVCHNVPAVGGAGTVLEARAAYRDPSGAIRGLNAAGDTLIHLFSVLPFTCQPAIPADANVIAHRASIPLFGAGLVEAIPDETLRSLEDPFDRNGDGVRGRAAIVMDLATGQPKVGRFGWKAQHATLVAFVADAFRNEMGIPSVLFPEEVRVRLQ